MAIEDEKIKEIKWYGIYDEWEYDYSGNYGKKRYFKKLLFATGTGRVPSNLVEITKEEYNANIQRNGERLTAYTKLESLV